MKSVKSVICVLLCFCCLGCHFFANAAEETSVVDDFTEKYKTLLQSAADMLDDLTGGLSSGIAGNLAKELKKYAPGELAKDLRAFLDETAAMSDAELKDTIGAAADRHSLTLNDSQLDTLVKLCRKLEKFSADELKEKLNGVKDSGGALVDSGEEAVENVSAAVRILNSVRLSVKKLLTGVKNFLESIRNIF